MAACSHHTGLAVTAVFKLMKGLLLYLLRLRLLKLEHAEIATLFSLLIEGFHLKWHTLHRGRSFQDRTRLLD